MNRLAIMFIFLILFSCSSNKTIINESKAYIENDVLYIECIFLNNSDTTICLNIGNLSYEVMSLEDENYLFIPGGNCIKDHFVLQPMSFKNMPLRSLMACSYNFELEDKSLELPCLVMIKPDSLFKYEIKVNINKNNLNDVQYNLKMFISYVKYDELFLLGLALNEPVAIISIGPEDLINSKYVSMNFDNLNTLKLANFNYCKEFYNYEFSDSSDIVNIVNIFKKNTFIHDVDVEIK